jgi:hypothetical protein
MAQRQGRNAKLLVSIIQTWFPDRSAIPPYATELETVPYYATDGGKQ